jgi:enoyl-CoA hydratase/carnithine racemase
MCGKLMSMPFAVIAALHGHAVAGGACLALACDYRIMRKDRGYIYYNEIDLPAGLPRGLATIALAKLPPTIARDMCLLGRRFGGEEGVECGMIDKAVELEEVMPEAMKLAQQLGEKDGKTFGLIRYEVYRTAIDMFNEAPLTCELDGFKRLDAALNPKL